MKEKEEAKEKSAARSALMQLQEDRKLLPIFPYREELLNAIENHQVQNKIRKDNSNCIVSSPKVSRPNF